MGSQPTPISQELRITVILNPLYLASTKQAAQRNQELKNGIQRKDEPTDRSASPDLIFESIDVMAGQNAINPVQCNMLAQTHSTLDCRLSGRPQIDPHSIIDEGYRSPELAIQESSLTNFLK